MSFIIDIFENLLKYNDKNIFIILDINNEIWFKLKDIYSILGYSNTRKSTYTTKVNSKNKVKYRYLKDRPLNAQPNAYFINEAGMYQLLTNSRKPIAIDFQNELFINILPSIRKTGLYIVKKNSNDKLNKLNKKLIKKINNIEDENNYYEDKHIYKPTQNIY
jgi:prophage antirepressor-like protein